VYNRKWAIAATTRVSHKELVLLFIEKGANHWDWAMAAADEGGHKDLVTLLEEIKQQKMDYTNKK
jgi:hypothetical protein